MRLGAATALVLLITAAPAAAIPGHHSVSSALRVSTLPAALATGSGDATHTCQAGDRRNEGSGVTSKRSKIIGDGRKTAVVACEQPPRSQLLTPDQVAKATAAALAVLG